MNHKDYKILPKGKFQEIILSKENKGYCARIWKDEFSIWYLDSFMNLNRNQIETILKLMNKQRSIFLKKKEVRKSLGEVQKR